MPRCKKIAADRGCVQEQLDRLGLDPVSELVELDRREVRLSQEDIGNPALQNLMADYEILPDPAGGYLLRPRLKTRLDALRTLLDFSKPKFRTTQIEGKVDHGVSIVIRQFGEGQPEAIDVSSHRGVLAEPEYGPPARPERRDRRIME